LLILGVPDTRELLILGVLDTGELQLNFLRDNRESRVAGSGILGSLLGELTVFFKLKAIAQPLKQQSIKK